MKSYNIYYKNQNKLKVEIMDRGYFWFVTGICDYLLDTFLFIKTIQKRQNLVISSIEFIPFKLDSINIEQLHKFAQNYNNSYNKFFKN